MGQVTRAYRADGSLRFDALAGLRSQYGDALASCPGRTSIPVPSCSCAASY